MSTEIRIEGDTLYLTRTFAAPRELVFEAWVETSKVQRWWGCAQTKSVQSTIECKVGGRYDHLMDLDGVGPMPMDANFTEYDPPRRLAYAPRSPEGQPAPPMSVTVDFVEVDGGTEVRLVHRGIPTEFQVHVRAGWTAAMEKLDGLLTEEATA